MDTIERMIAAVQSAWVKPPSISSGFEMNPRPAAPEVKPKPPPVFCQCGDRALMEHDKFGPKCHDCLLELVYGEIPPYTKVTDGRVGHVPKGMAIRRRQRMNEPNNPVDYFGESS